AYDHLLAVAQIGHPDLGAERQGAVSGDQCVLVVPFTVCSTFSVVHSGVKGGLALLAEALVLLSGARLRWCRGGCAFGAAGNEQGKQKRDKGPCSQAHGVSFSVG